VGDGGSLADEEEEWSVCTPLVLRCRVVSMATIDLLLRVVTKHKFPEKRRAKDCHEEAKSGPSRVWIKL